MKTEANCTIHPVKMDAHCSEFGLTKREYFAAMAMQRLVAHGSTKDEVDIKYMITDRAVLIADHLIQQLNQKQP